MNFSKHCKFFLFFLDSFTCATNGEFSSEELPTCSVPKICSNPPNVTDDSGLATPSQSSVKAYRSVSYFCKNTSLVMNTHGKEYKVLCKADGNFAVLDESVTCRVAANCTGPIPVPPESSNMDNSTTSLATLKEFDEAVYKCTDTSHVVGKKPENLNCFILKI